MTEFIDNSQLKIRLAVNRLQKKYCTNPFRFLTEADIQCALYSELSHGFSKKGTAKSCDVNGKRLNEYNYQVVTIPLHAELSSDRRAKKEFVDLCIIEPPKLNVWVTKTKFSRFEGRFPFWQWEWEPRESIGLEIKFNYWLSKNKNMNTDKPTKNWKNVTSSPP